jgi:hypothetical protein
LAGDLVVHSVEGAALEHNAPEAKGRVRLSSLGAHASVTGAVLSVMERTVPSFRVVTTTTHAGES